MENENSGQPYDLAVVGAGSAAEAAAAEARRRGKSVVLVERGLIGGTCSSVGCVPSKSLLAAAAVRATAEGSRFPGISTSAGPVDLAQLVADKDDMLAQVRQLHHVEKLAADDIDVLEGSAAFTGSPGRPVLVVTALDGTETRLVPDQIVIASGAQPVIPEIPGLRNTDYLTYASAMALDHVPESLLVIGGNAVGLEQAQLFARLGAKTTVVEIAPRIAPNEDPTLSTALEQALGEEGIAFRTATTLTRVQQTRTGVIATVVFAGETRTITAEKILIATGRLPATDGLNLAAVGVDTGRRGEVVVDEQLRTDNPRIWAAGDVTGNAQFVYAAHAQGTIAAANALGDEKDTLDYAALPRVTFTSPALAAVGMTPAEAEAAGQEYEYRELPMQFVPRAILERKANGVLKLISEPSTQRLLGVHMVGDEAGDIITAATYALTAGLTTQQLATTWAPAFTMGESLKLAAQLPPIAGQ
ncbi:mercury(II) reductase [Saccharopolyspora sp. NPDC049426]|uniref:mercury(II) reductase n=1 Tax=Saccharopolyspora sp. NPDC049426 TaxID=3155652 RepID=UPI00341BA68E